VLPAAASIDSPDGHPEGAAMIRREVKWAGAGAVLFIVLLGFSGVLERLSWWLLVVLSVALSALSWLVGDAMWRRRRGEE
jgi:hypothetical protein